jgi:hypothetical protein
MKPTLITITLFVCAWAASAQAPAAAGRIIGEVTAVDAAAKQIGLKSDKGDSVAVALNEKTLFLRVPPGEKDLKKATRINLSDIAQGDRVLARGTVSDDQKSIAAASVIVMSKSDIAQMHQRRREEWQQRGMTGTISLIDEAAKRFTITTRTREGTKPVTVETSDKTEMWRYAPDSIRFSDAKPSAFAEIKTGDQVRVLGEKSADAASVKAEQIVSGTFRQVAGTVVSVNAASGEVKITDLATKKPLTVKVNEDSTLKKLPQPMAEMMARRLNPAAAGAPADGGRPAQGGPGGGGRGPGGGPDMQQMMERMPALTLADLKTGDAIIVSSTSGADPARLTAIALVAGVEPLLRAAPAAATNFGGWNFGEIGLPQ